VRHSIAFLDLLEEGWWEDSYPLHPEEVIKKYHGLYCSSWGTMLARKSERRLGKRFYKYLEVGSYDEPYIRITIRDKDSKRTSELLQNIVAKCFLDKKDKDIVRFRNGNTYDCHIWNLYLEPRNGSQRDDLPKGSILQEWECKQCKGIIQDAEELHFKHDTLFCSENCADIFEEDLKFVEVSVDLLDEDWYNTPQED
jgi:hypothetical protein